MKHFNLRYAMLSAAVMLTLGMTAQETGVNLTLQEAGFVEGQGYTMQTKARSWWSATDTKLETYKEVFAQYLNSYEPEEGEDLPVAETAPNPDDINQNYGFVIFNGDIYLYSLGKQKFVTHDGDGLFSEVGDPLYISFTPDDTFNYFFSFADDRSAYNFNDNGTIMKIDSWNTYDDGNQYRVLAASHTFDANAVRAQLNKFFADKVKVDLLSLIENAIAMGVDVTDAQAVYDDPNATAEQVQAAIVELRQRLADAASPEHPVDMTSYIVNPSFDENVDGWESTTGVTPELNHQADTPDGTISGGYCNFKQGANTTSIEGHIYQDIEGLPQGVYRCQMAVYVAALGNNDFDNPEQYVFAETSYGLEKSPITQALKIYDWFAFVGEDGHMQIGFAEDAPVTKWIVFDNVRLTYYGNSLASYQYAAIDIKNQVENNYPPTDENGESNYTLSYSSGIDEIAENAVATTTPEEAIAVYHQAQRALTDLATSVGLYQRLKEELENLDYYIYQYGLDMGEFVVQLEGILADASMENDELKELLDNIRQQETDFVKQNIQDGNEYPFIENGTFPNASLEGWTLTGTDGCKGGDSGVIEFWNVQGWDLSQKLTGMKPGVWRFEVSALYGSGNDAGTRQNNWNNNLGRDEGTNKVHTYFSVNDEQETVVNMHTAGVPQSEYPEAPADWLGRLEGFWYESTFQAYDEEGNPVGDPIPQWEPGRINTVDTQLHLPGHEKDYTKSVKGLVGEDGELTIRLWNDDYANEIGMEWSVIQEVRLYFEADNAEAIAPILARVIENAKQLAANPMESGEKKALQDAISNAEAVVNGTDGKAMMDAYNALQRVTKSLTTIEAYKELQEKNNELVDMIDIYGDKADDDVLNRAEALYYEVLDGIATGKFNAEECSAKIEEINELIFALKIPKGTASDSNPLDYTAVLTNAKFTDGQKGWTFTAGGVEQEDEVGMGVAEIYNANGEIYQEITRLPAGTYKVTVQGFYRQNGPVSHLKTFTYNKALELGKLDWLEKSDTTGVVPFECTARFFANADSIDAVNMTAGFPPTNEEEDVLLRTAPGSGWTEYEWWLGGDDPDADGTIYYFPNMRNAAGQRFATGFYQNEFFAYVSDEGDGKGTLRLGVKMENQHGNDWCPFSNWKLYYYGTESQFEDQTHKPTGIESIDLNSVTKEAIFTLDGRRQQQLHRGINIVRMQTADGRTVVRKVLVK